MIKYYLSFSFLLVCFLFSDSFRFLSFFLFLLIIKRFACKRKMYLIYITRLSIDWPLYWIGFLFRDIIAYLSSCFFLLFSLFSQSLSLFFLPLWMKTEVLSKIKTDTIYIYINKLLYTFSLATCSSKSLLRSSSSRN